MAESSEGYDSSSNEAREEGKMKKTAKRPRDDTSKEDERKVKRKKYGQKYNLQWGTMESFKQWITKSDKGEYYFYCKVCKKDYSSKGGKPDVQKHADSKSHQRVSSEIRQPTITRAFSETSTLSMQVKYAEIKLSAFAVQQHNSFNSIGDFVELAKDIYPDSIIAQKMSCQRSKSTAIVKNVTGQYRFEQIVNSIRTRKFSLLIDESTDVSAVKHLAMIVRYFDGTGIVDRFLALVPVSDATADNLYKQITDFFIKHKIPYKDNLIGFASDGASNMFGAHHSVAVLLQRDVNHLFLQKCICHSWALCASYACQKLPRIVEDLARDIYNYFKHSYKRQRNLEVVQSILNLKPHKILRLCGTRWLSLLQVVRRLLEQYDALIVYFATETIEDKLVAAEMISHRLNEPYVKMYLQFLDAVLPLFNDLNLEMQSTKTQIHRLYDRVSGVYRTLLDAFVKRDYLVKTPLEKINFRDPHNQCSLEKIYLGGELTILIEQGECKLSGANLTDFRVRCLSFYIESCAQIIKRFNFADLHVQKLKQLSIIDPAKVIAGELASIAPLAKSFPNLVDGKCINAIDSECRQLRNIEFSKDTPLEPCAFWTMVYNLQRGDGTQKFPLTSAFVMNLLCLPHSTAAVERLFSELSLAKTDQRNRLQSDALTGIMHTKDLLDGKGAVNLEITKDLVAKHSAAMYDTSERDT